MSATTDLTPEINNRLQGYRRQIDAIDNELISLLKNRIGIVSQVGKMKREDTRLRNFIRSGREAVMVKRIWQEFQGNGFAPEAASAMWRLIIAASTHHETPLSLALPESLSATAGDYFGTFLPQAYCSAEAALAMAAEHTATIALIPADSPLPAVFPDNIKIFALLPFIPTATLRPPAYAAAQLIPEETGADISLFYDAKTGEIHSKPGYHTHYHSHQWLGSYATPIENNV